MKIHGSLHQLLDEFQSYDYNNGNVVDHEGWLISLLGEVGLLSETMASIRISELHVGEAQMNWYQGKMVSGVHRVHDTVGAWLQDIEGMVRDAMKEVGVDMDDKMMLVTPLRGQPDTVSLGHGHKTFPYDLPVHQYVTNIVGEFTDKNGNKANGLLGWRLITDIYVFGQKLEILIMRDPTMARNATIDFILNGDVLAQREFAPLRPPVKNGDRATRFIAPDKLDGAKLAADADVILEDDTGVSLISPSEGELVLDDDDPIMDDDEILEDGDDSAGKDSDDIAWE